MKKFEFIRLNEKEIKANLAFVPGKRYYADSVKGRVARVQHAIDIAFKKLNSKPKTQWVFGTRCEPI